MLPIACTLTDPELARRRAELLGGVLRDSKHVEALSNGCRWRFAYAPDLLTRLASVIEAERHCCRFLTFDIHAEPDQGDVQLDVTGPEGTTGFLADWLS